MKKQLLSESEIMRKYSNIVAEAENTMQLDEGMLDSVKAMVMKIPGISQYIKAAENLKPQLAIIAKNSRSGSEALEQVKSLAAGAQQPVIASEGDRFKSIVNAGAGTALLILGKLGGFYDSILQYYQQGDTGMAAAGVSLTVLPMVIALMMAVVLWQQANENDKWKQQSKQKTIR
jgi:hypothetical protein